MKSWHDLLRKVLREGEARTDRTGVGTTALFGERLELQNFATFPVVTTKQLAWGQVKAEMSAFIRGYTALEDFHKVGCKIWDGNAKGRADLGPIYGAQWRNWQGIDQFIGLYNTICDTPDSRRLLVSAWNVTDLAKMSLPPCPFAFQVRVSNGGFLDMVVYQRSCDLFLGLPFDIAGYALLQRLIAKTTDYQSGKLVFMLGDAHIYNNHIEGVQTVLERQPLPPPMLELSPHCNMFDFEPNDANLKNYVHHGTVRGILNV